MVFIHSAVGFPKCHCALRCTPSQIKAQSLFDDLPQWSPIVRSPFFCLTEKLVADFDSRSHAQKYIIVCINMQVQKGREWISEVDVTISYKDGIIFIEAKYLAPVNLRTTSDPRRDQIIRYLDLAAYHYLNHPDGVKEFYFVLIIDTEKPPRVLTPYWYTWKLLLVIKSCLLEDGCLIFWQRPIRRFFGNRAIVRRFSFWYILYGDISQIPNKKSDGEWVKEEDFKHGKLERPNND
jgi:hypothetical protein